MSEHERNKLLDEKYLLKALLDFHVLNRGLVQMTDREFEEYADAVLDRLLEIEHRLNENN